MRIHQNRTAPFAGWTPASKAAPPAGANSCLPVLNHTSTKGKGRPLMVGGRPLHLQLGRLVHLLGNAQSQTTTWITSKRGDQGGGDGARRPLSPIRHRLRCIWSPSITPHCRFIKVLLNNSKESHIPWLNKILILFFRLICMLAYVVSFSCS